MWYKLSKISRQHYVNYCIPQTVLDMYNKHQNLSVEEINELVELAEDMYKTNGYIQFCKVAKYLTDPNISAIRLETIFFL